ncbi:MAG: hypothetical protein QGI38_03525 [Candidatus Woesearchaeota archaeon]|jgi:hypothetical protein|nr:hypothetical protein [Candidatus Woesearchaeota archaeon]|tara:strand:+ start:165 stop:1295 length:1131 start_codon:yes stop_codon:yes gene_type:complete
MDKKHLVHNKKGQLAIFIIIGVVMILVFFIFFSNDLIFGADDLEGEVTEISQIELETAPINGFVEECLKQTAKDAIFYIGQQGGYYNLDNVLDAQSENFESAYYLNIDKNLMPSKKTVEYEISYYINDLIGLCFNDFEVFRDQGYEISYDKLSSSVELNEENAKIELDMPISINRLSAQKNIDRFLVTIDTRFGVEYDFVKNIMDNQMLDTDSISLSYIYSESYLQDLSVIMDYEEDSQTYFFVIVDNKMNETSDLIFANKYKEYSCDNLPDDATTFEYEDCLEQRMEELGYRFYIGDIPDMTVRVGRELNYKMNALGLNLVFDDFTPLFDIGKDTGIIKFTPTETQVGNYTILIHVIDNTNRDAYKEFNLEIIPE